VGFAEDVATEMNAITSPFNWKPRLKTARPIKLFSVGVGLLAAAYVVAFALRFEVLSDPVRDNVHGWLGPVIRGDSAIVDIGKVYYFEGTDTSSYQMFRPLCRAWLWIMGLS
jgi:hypothetical protein